MEGASRSTGRYSVKLEQGETRVKVVETFRSVSFGCQKDDGSLVVFWYWEIWRKLKKKPQHLYTPCRLKSFYTPRDPIVFSVDEKQRTRQSILAERLEYTLYFCNLLYIYIWNIYIYGIYILNIFRKEAVKNWLTKRFSTRTVATMTTTRLSLDWRLEYRVSLLGAANIRDILDIHCRYRRRRRPAMCTRRRSSRSWSSFFQDARSTVKFLRE